MHRIVAAFTFMLGAIRPGVAADVVPAGAGSYLRGLPDGAKGPPQEIYKTPEVAGRPMPSNDWWSSLTWMRLSEAMYPHPLAVKAEAGGLRVAYPGANITATDAAIFGSMGGVGKDDLVLGHSAVPEFATAAVAGWSDWFVSAQMGEPARGMRLTFGHGSPFVFGEFAGGDPVVTLTHCLRSTRTSGARERRRSRDRSIDPCAGR